MLDANVAGAPVVDDAGQLVGVLSEADLIIKVGGASHNNHSTRRTAAAAVVAAAAAPAAAAARGRRQGADLHRLLQTHALQGAGRPDEHFLIPPIYLGIVDSYVMLRDNKAIQTELTKMSARTVRAARGGGRAGWRACRQCLLSAVRCSACSAPRASMAGARASPALCIRSIELLPLRAGHHTGGGRDGGQGRRGQRHASHAHERGGATDAAPRHQPAAGCREPKAGGGRADAARRAPRHLCSWEDLSAGDGGRAPLSTTSSASCRRCRSVVWMRVLLRATHLCPASDAVPACEHPCVASTFVDGFHASITIDRSVSSAHPVELLQQSSTARTRSTWCLPLAGCQRRPLLLWLAPRETASCPP